MAVPEIDNAMVIEFSAQVHVAAQQSKARMRPYVNIKAMSGDVFAYDGLGQVEAAEITTRHTPVVFSDISHNRRKISRRRFALTLPIDASDVRGMLLSPQSEYAMACARAMERVFDRIVVEALFADVYTGRDFGTTVAFATDGGYTVTATAGLTYEKLVEINQNWIDGDVGNDAPVTKILGITGDEHTSLMKENELTNGDFTRASVVDAGEIVKANGLNIIKFAGAITRPILSVTAAVRSCFAMAQGGMCVGVSKEMAISIKDRADLYETTQVEIIFELGAVRTEGKLVQRVTATE
jgi:hypothetical protein